MIEWISLDGEKIKDPPPDAIGFLYLIEDLDTGKRYLGRKLLTKVARRKGRRVRVESDWRTYWSSSPLLQEQIELRGKDRFRRIILCWAPSKSCLNYLEELGLYMLGALEQPDKWYNTNIRAKVFGRNVQKQLETINKGREIFTRILNSCITSD